MNGTLPRRGKPTESLAQKYAREQAEARNTPLTKSQAELVAEIETASINALPSVAQAQPASEKQIGYIGDLMLQRDWETLVPGKNSRPLNLPDELTKKQASEVISWLLRRPILPKSHPKQQITLEEAKAHGRATGRCYVCHRQLTNEVSVREGIGPICSGAVLMAKYTYPEIVTPGSAARTFQYIAGGSRVVHIQRVTDGNRAACGAKIHMLEADITKEPGDKWVNCRRCPDTYTMARARLQGFVSEVDL